MKIRFILLLLVIAGCAGGGESTTQTGLLSGGTLSVQNTTGNIEAFPPAAGDAFDKYTVVTTRPVHSSASTTIHNDSASKTLTVQRTGEPATAVNLLVRVPKGTHAVIQTQNGSLHVSDVQGTVDAINTDGDIKVQIPGYANARTVNGNLSILFGDANWPGTLHFATQRGDIEVYVPATANAKLDLHTDAGTIFTDFNLRGNASGSAETILGPIGGGGPRTVEVRVGYGNIRVLKLLPQM